MHTHCSSGAPCARGTGGTAGRLLSVLYAARRAWLTHDIGTAPSDQAAYALAAIALPHLVSVDQRAELFLNTIALKYTAYIQPSPYYPTTTQLLPSPNPGPNVNITDHT